MKIWKVEIAELAIIAILLISPIIFTIILVGEIDIEKEKTEQLRIELQIEQQRNEKGRL